MRTLSLGLGAAAATFVVLFAMVGALYLVQLFGVLGLFWGVEALLVGTAIWLHQTRRQVPEWIAVSAIAIAVLLLLVATLPTYHYPMGVPEPLKQH